jgi:predicted nucleic acid-binding protein
LRDLHYIDTSYLAPYYLPEENSEAIEKNLVKLPTGSLVISSLVRAEFASLLSRKCRAKEMDKPDARRTMTALDSHIASGTLHMLSVTSRDFDQATQWIMGMKHPLKAPDGLHLAIAARHDAVLLTLDRGLARVARWVGLKTRR